jgi:hypothetical protein
MDGRPYVAPMSVMIVLAWVITVGLRRIAATLVE